MNLNFKILVSFGILLGLLSSCGDSYSRHDRTASNKNSGNLHGSEGEGFSGMIDPKITRIITPDSGFLPKGTVITVNGSDLFKEMNIKISKSACKVIKVYASDTLTCAITEDIIQASELKAVIVNSEGEESSSQEVAVTQGVDDRDGDGIADDIDNCPYDVNPYQEDSNYDGVGDACAPIGCDDVMDSGSFIDDCGVCGYGANECNDCAGIPNGPALNNNCGECGEPDRDVCL